MNQTRRGSQCSANELSQKGSRVLLYQEIKKASVRLMLGFALVCTSLPAEPTRHANSPTAENDQGNTRPLAEQAAPRQSRRRDTTRRLAEEAPPPPAPSLALVQEKEGLTSRFKDPEEIAFALAGNADGLRSQKAWSSLSVEQKNEIKTAFGSLYKPDPGEPFDPTKAVRVVVVDNPHKVTFTIQGKKKNEKGNWMDGEVYRFAVPNPPISAQAKKEALDGWYKEHAPALANWMDKEAVKDDQVNRTKEDLNDALGLFERTVTRISKPTGSPPQTTIYFSDDTQLTYELPPLSNK